MTVLTSFNRTFTMLTADSRKVQPGALFLAYPGVHNDGRNYITQAIEAGAAAVVWESLEFAWNPAWQIENVGVAGLKDQVGAIAAEFYGHPSSQLSMVGVTGTNGKTSVSQWIAQALTLVGRKTAVIGTIGNGFTDKQHEAANTTPDAILLQGMLADYLAQHAASVVMEVSSHGLHQGRVNGVKFDVAVLTNLSRDHLDYHETMEAYAAAKAMLFTWPGLRSAVINADDAFGQRLIEKLTAEGKSVLTYGMQAGVVRATELVMNQRGLTMQITTPQGNTSVHAPVLGRFNAYNVLAVLAALLALNVPLTEAVAAIARLQPVAGRMQQFGGEGKPLVVVDYAHTPDALEKVLQTLREQTEGKLLCVFGCGGNRDAGKRPLMAQVACSLADRVIVTSDNPRDENPADIIQQVMHGVEAKTGAEAKCVAEQDRASAIRQAVLAAQPQDIVLVAGKGHENYQEIAGVKMPFSDAAIAQDALAERSPQHAMMHLSEAARVLDATLIGPDVAFFSVGSDSRNIQPGQLFVAIKGEKFDGNVFAAEAIAKGAAAAIVSDQAAAARPALVVDDARLALGRLASYWRSKFTMPLVAVTGSNGKTTTKEMLAAILAAAAGDANKVHATYGNLNNDIGLPLTLLKIAPWHAYVVAEMGMNHLGEIEYMTRLAKPDVAVINNANTAHIGELGSRENIARAKGEIFSGLQTGGIAVINADNDFADYWHGLNVGRKVVTFGLHKPADVSATFREEAGVSHVRLTTPHGQVNVELKVEGVHNISNALAASAAAYALGIGNAAIAAGLQRFGGVYGRLERKRAINGATLIDDTYNANPDSMKAAIDVLAKQAGEKLLVTGDMGELGADAEKMHAEIGLYAKAAGLKRLFCLGNTSQETVKAFGVGAEHFETPEALAAAVQPLLDSNSTVLIKGSRFMRMERVVNLLAAKQQQNNQGE